MGTLVYTCVSTRVSTCGSPFVGALVGHISLSPALCFTDIVKRRRTVKWNLCILSWLWMEKLVGAFMMDASACSLLSTAYKDQTDFVKRA